MDILVYSDFINNRLRFVCDEILLRRSELSYRITDNAEQFQSYDGPAINYSLEQLGGLNIRPAGLLSEKVKPEAEPRPFQSMLSSKGVLMNPLSSGIDVFSEVFFHLSRWEEYEVKDLDNYGRFKAENSVLFKNGLLDIPVVEVLAQSLWRDLRSLYPHLPLPKRQYTYIPSVDIDNAFAYRHKDFFRTAASTGKDILQLRFQNLFQRFKVLLKGEKDPYDTYDLLDSAHRRCAERAIYFFLLADEGKYDRNLAFSNPAMKDLVFGSAQKYKVGIHPGMGSNSSSTALTVEKQRLEELTGRPCYQSRQHYLYLKFPETYRALIKAGIREDYSMGFASQTGFRAGTCLPFSFYDLQAEQITELTVYPFAFMDATLHLYLGLNEEDSLKRVRHLVNEIRNVNGLCISLWHNETLGGIWHWRGWEEVYSKIVSICES